MKFEINKKEFDQFPELESDRLKYTRITLKDSETLFEIRTNTKVMKFMDIEEMKSISESENLIKSITESFNLGTGISWGIIEKSINAFIGYFGFWRIDIRHCRGEIGYALHPNYWGKGYMKETADKLIKYGFGKLNLHSIEANVNPENLPSIKLLEKIGFRKEAHFRENFLFKNEFKDSVIYSLLEKDIIKE
ncbi:GNAT family N-acetyltransferase [candidate division KSB1 bacterium]|nr:GNAT family N-acetyltransferase [candidate division KSB1 bacterium]